MFCVYFELLTVVFVEDFIICAIRRSPHIFAYCKCGIFMLKALLFFELLFNKDFTTNKHCGFMQHIQ